MDTYDEEVILAPDDDDDGALVNFDAEAELLAEDADAEPTAAAPSAAPEPSRPAELEDGEIDGEAAGPPTHTEGPNKRARVDRPAGPGIPGAVGINMGQRVLPARPSPMRAMNGRSAPVRPPAAVAGRMALTLLPARERTPPAVGSRAGRTRGRPPSLTPLPPPAFRLAPDQPPWFRPRPAGPQHGPFPGPYGPPHEPGPMMQPPLRYLPGGPGPSWAGPGGPGPGPHGPHHYPPHGPPLPGPRPAWDAWSPHDGFGGGPPPSSLRMHTAVLRPGSAWPSTSAPPAAYGPPQPVPLRPFPRPAFADAAPSVPPVPTARTIRSRPVPPPPPPPPAGPTAMRAPAPTARPAPGPVAAPAPVPAPAPGPAPAVTVAATPPPANTIEIHDLSRTFPFAKILEHFGQFGAVAVRDGAEVAAGRPRRCRRAAQTWLTSGPPLSIANAAPGPVARRVGR